MDEGLTRPLALPPARSLLLAVDSPHKEPCSRGAEVVLLRKRPHLEALALGRWVHGHTTLLLEKQVQNAVLALFTSAKRREAPVSKAAARGPSLPASQLHSAALLGCARTLAGSGGMYGTASSPRATSC